MKTNKEIKLVNELFELWENLAQNGELYIGINFPKNYERLKKQVAILNSSDATINDKKTPTFEEFLVNNGYKQIGDSFVYKNESGYKNLGWLSQMYTAKYRIQ